MKKILFLVLLIISFNNILYSQKNQTHFKIQVVDSKSKEPLPFATILINNDQHKGNVTNLNGWCEFYLSPSDSCIQISYIGYETKFIKRNHILPTIKLKAIDIKIAEVIIYPGENPAHRIIKNAVKNRKINSPDKIPEYACTIYNKSIYNYIFEDKAKKDSSFQDFIELFDDSHVILMESATERFYKSPDKTKEIIKKVRVSGFKDPSIAPLSTDIQPFHFYDPLVQIFNVTYLNPISLGSHKKYFFLIEDTLYHQNDTTFIISFKPKKNTNFEGLKGFIHIKTKQFAIENVVASPSEKKLMEVHVQQMYEYKNEHWFPKEIKSELKWDNLYNMGIGMNVKSESYITSFRTNIPKDSVKYNEEVLIFDKLATKNAKIEMDNLRYIELSEKDKNTYTTMDSIGKKEHFDYWLSFGEEISENKLPIKKFYMPIDKFYTYNDFEGSRLGLGLYTNDKLINWLELGGWGAYGFRDKKWKYGGDLKLYFDQKKENILSGSYQYDALFPGNEDFARNESYFEGYFLQQADYSTKVNVSFQTRMKYLQLRLAILNDKRSPQYNYSFLLNNNWVKEYETTEFSAQIRFAYKEKYIWQLKQKLLIESKWPILTVGYKKGLKGFYGGELDYEKLWVQLDYKYHFPRLGESKIRVEAGKVWGNIPYSFLFSGAGGWNSTMPFFVENRFNTMSPNQFANNEIINAYFSHNFGTRLFSTPKWKPKVMITQAFGIGNLTNKTFHKDITLTDMNKGYYESGLVINEILRYNFFNFFYLGVGGGIFYNYGYYSSNNWENNIKLKISGNISF